MATREELLKARIGMPRCASCDSMFDDSPIGRRSARNPSVCVSCDDLNIQAECEDEQERYERAKEYEAEHDDFYTVDMDYVARQALANGEE